MKKLILLVFIFLLISLAIYFLFRPGTAPNETLQNCDTKLQQYSIKESFRGNLAPVDFSDFPEAKTYYTRITETVKRGVNFSGRYVLIPAGCGTDCVLFAVVDVKTGKIIAYNSGKANYHLINRNNYFVLEPVFAGQTREFYKIIESDSGSRLEMVCSEESKTDMYGIPKEAKP